MGEGMHLNFDKYYSVPSRHLVKTYTPTSGIEESVSPQFALTMKWIIKLYLIGGKCYNTLDLISTPLIIVVAENNRAFKSQR